MENMKRLSKYVVVYDISDNKERRHVNNILIGFGFRVQKSVFECLLDKRYYNQMLQKLNDLKVKTGFIKIYKKEKLRMDEIVGINNTGDIDSGNAYIF
jgi:CRISPR-associated protein Cas2